MDIAQKLYTARPTVLSEDPKEHAKEIFKVGTGSSLLHCYSIVFLQERERYNRLINAIDATLGLLIKAIQGLVLMSPELDQMYSSLLKNRVPANWEQVSYASLRPLASWQADLHKRVEFMRRWATKGHPEAYWLSGLFFPHGFMTGVLQAHARKHNKAIDFLKFRFSCMNFALADCCTEGTSHADHPQAQSTQHKPEDGVYVYGMYLESATWSYADNCLREQRPGIIVEKMPVIHFLPFEVKHKVPKPFIPVTFLAAPEQEGPLDSRKTSKRGKSVYQKKQEQQPKIQEVIVYEGEEDTDIDNPNIYQCPVYKTSERAGTLNTTGQSTNYILSVGLPIDTKEASSEHWTLRGTAIVTMQDD